MKVTRHPVSEFLKAVTIIGHFAVIMRHNQNATRDCLLFIKSTSPGFLLYSFFSFSIAADHAFRKPRTSGIVKISLVHSASRIANVQEFAEGPRDGDTKLVNTAWWQRSTTPNKWSIYRVGKKSKLLYRDRHFEDWTIVLTWNIL